MKIGIDARMYSSKFTGIGRYTYELIQNLAEIDGENEYRIFLNNPEFETFISPRANFTPVLVNAKHYSINEQTTFLKTLLKAKCDLVHFTHFNAPLLYRKPFVVTIHDLTLSFFPGKKMTSKLSRFAYHQVIGHAIRDSKKIIAVSENTKNDILKLYSVPPEKIIVTYEGIGEEFRKAVSDERLAVSIPTPLEGGRGEFSLPSLEIGNWKLEIPFLLYTGVWREHKNLKRLMQAYLDLIKEHSGSHTCNLQPATCNSLPDLVITGKKDPLYGEILDMPKMAGLENRVHFVGHVSESELIQLYQNAAAFVFPSLYEGFGLPPLEAMQCGTPVLSSNSSCLPEICADAALYFDPLSVEDIKTKILELLDNQELQNNLVQKGLKNVERFSWKEMAEQTLECYNLVAS